MMYFRSDPNQKTGSGTPYTLLQFLKTIRTACHANGRQSDRRDYAPD